MSAQTPDPQTPAIQPPSKPAPAPASKLTECPHADPFIFCQECKADPCPLGLGTKSPPPKPVLSSIARPLEGRRIAIDAGHGLSNAKPGRYDPGATAAGHEEADIALEWANATGKALEALGAAVIYTRPTKGAAAPLRYRTQHAAERKADTFVSFHMNASDGRGHGTETFYRHLTSKPLAKAINDALVAVLGTRDRGIKTEESSARGSIHVLGYRPNSVLIEIAFIDHTTDRERARSKHNIDAGAKAIAQAILAVRT